MIIVPGYVKSKILSTYKGYKKSNHGEKQSLQREAGIAGWHNAACEKFMQARKWKRLNFALRIIMTDG